MAQEEDCCVICFQFIICCGRFILADLAEAFTTNSSSHSMSDGYYPFYPCTSCLSTLYTKFGMFIRILCIN